MTFRKPICGSVSRWGATRASEGRSIFSTLNSKSGIKTHYKGHKGMKLELSSLRWRENREDFFREDLGVQDHRRVRLFSRFQKHWCLDSTSWFRIRIERKHWWGNEHATIHARSIHFACWESPEIYIYCSRKFSIHCFFHISITLSW